MTTPANSSLNSAKLARQDEFYTQLTDIERELWHYKDHFRGKVVYCNCDDPRVSNFFRYFALNFEFFGMKKLIATCYKSQDAGRFSRNDSGQAVYLEYTGDKDGNRMPDAWEVDVRPLTGDGDFRSPESIALLKQADIVVTNPPFSLFREYVAQLLLHAKWVTEGAATLEEAAAMLDAEAAWYRKLAGLGYVMTTGFENGTAELAAPPGGDTENVGGVPVQDTEQETGR
jgi:hypothetical protein